MMTQSTTVAATPTPVTTEKTFSSYNQEQGKTYAQSRRNYSPQLYQTVIDHHTSTGGQLNTVLDVGCGPGLATYSLAPFFKNAIGLDPSSGMIATARSFSSSTESEDEAPSIRFEVSTAETLGSQLNPPIPDASIDLVTAANAAHWFDMAGFWAAAARVLKPGGSVALWCSGEVRVHPDMPAAAAIQEAMDRHQENYLEQYRTPGNELARGRYVDLPLPWTLEEPVAGFEEKTFFRKEWDAGERMHVGGSEATLDQWEAMMGTGSSVTRWRQANPEAVGTEKDVMRIFRREIERLLHEAGVEKGKEKVRGATRGALLMVKRI